MTCAAGGLPAVRVSVRTPRASAATPSNFFRTMPMNILTRRPLRLIAGAAAALLVTTVGSVALAKGHDGYLCQTWNPVKSGPAVTHCLTWTREAAARMRAAGCDPAMTNGSAMRSTCAELVAGREQSGAQVQSS
jgi:hypothetical protein